MSDDDDGPGPASPKGRDRAAAEAAAVPSHVVRHVFLVPASVPEDATLSLQDWTRPGGAAPAPRRPTRTGPAVHGPDGPCLSRMGRASDAPKRACRMRQCTVPALPDLHIQLYYRLLGSMPPPDDSVKIKLAFVGTAPYEQRALCHQVLRHTRPHGSWFVGSDVTSSGHIYFVAPVDPLFFLLPLLRANTSKFRSHAPTHWPHCFMFARLASTRQALNSPSPSPSPAPSCTLGLSGSTCRPLSPRRSTDDIFEGQPEWLKSLATPEALGLVCEVQILEDETYVKVDQARLLAWLRVKAPAAAAAAAVPLSPKGNKSPRRTPKKAPSASKSPARSPARKPTPKRAPVAEDEAPLLLQCIGLVADWVEPPLADLLIKSYGLDPLQAVSGQTVKRSLDASLAPEIQRSTLLRYLACSISFSSACLASAWLSLVHMQPRNRRRSHGGDGDEDGNPKKAAKVMQSQNIKKLQQGSSK
eukprot:gene11208-2035_t